MAHVNIFVYTGVLSVSSVPGGGGELPVTSAEQCFFSPFYPDEVMAAGREEWILRADEGKIITLEVIPFVWL